MIAWVDRWTAASWLWPGLDRRGGMLRWARWCLIVAGAVAVLFPGAGASAQPRGLSKFESRAYVVHTNLTREEALEYGVHMDLIYQAYSERFSVLRGRERRKLNLYLLRTRRDYIEAMASFGISAEASGGMFFWGGSIPGGSGMSTWVEGLSREQVFSTLQHEGFHQFAHVKLGDQLPLWVNEGLAEYFGAAIIVDGKVKMGIVDADRIEKITRALENNQALPFRELLEIQSGQWHENMQSRSPKGSLQYDQSWATVHFLIHGDKGRYRSAFGDYLVDISKGRAHRQAWGEAFGNNTGRFAQRWKKFLSEVEPDDYSVALKRLQFLGSGLQFLHQNDPASPPADVEALREALQSRGFKVTWRTEAGPRETDSADAALYAYADRRGKEHAFEVVPAEEGTDLPPSIWAPNLKPAVTLGWIEDEQGNVRSRLQYGQAAKRRK